jgi:hypothetical protein
MGAHLEVSKVDDEVMQWMRLLDSAKGRCRFGWFCFKASATVMG